MVTRGSRFAPSAVYNTQVKTATVGLRIIPGQWHLLRLVPAYRTPESLAARSRLARAVRIMRQAGLPFPRPPVQGVCTTYPDGLHTVLA
jgi:hypothetical protein